MKRLPTQILKAIGTEVRRRRISAGYTIECLAGLASMHKNYLGRVELGQADLSVSALWSIARALDCELLELFPSTRHTINLDVLAAARLLSEADKEVRDAVITVLTRVPSTRRRWLASAGE